MFLEGMGEVMDAINYACLLQNLVSALLTISF